MTVVTDGSEEVTKEAAVESLGEKAKRYVVTTWGVAGEEESEEVGEAESEESES